MEVLNEWECSHSSKLKILMVTINSLVMPYQSVAVLALRLVIEYLQISYLLFKPNVSILCNFRRQFGILKGLTNHGVLYL